MSHVSSLPKRSADRSALSEPKSTRARQNPPIPPIVDPAKSNDCPIDIGGFIETPNLVETKSRIKSYLSAGYPVHLRGPAGSGKTSLAMQIAAESGQPVAFITGDANYTSANLVGREAGMRTRRLVDRYVESVTRMDVESTPAWIDELLTTACLQGHTLVYDEFTRSTAEANNVLLSVLEERILVLPSAARGQPHIQVHPDFKVIFTSNPVDYAGVHQSQDALLDRMITIDLEHPDRLTELAIVEAHSGLPKTVVASIVDMVRDVRRSGEVMHQPSLRAALMIARVAALEGMAVRSDEPRFVRLCLDILESKTHAHRLEAKARSNLRQSLVRLIEYYFNHAEAT